MHEKSTGVISAVERDLGAGRVDRKELRVESPELRAESGELRDESTEPRARAGESAVAGAS